MKSSAIALTTAALIFGFAAPSLASVTKSLVSASSHDATVVYQQSKCKEGEVWNEDEKKCMKKDG